MQNNNLQSILGHMDIYLIDQIMKGRYNPSDLILDAGCGSGRNLHWFLQNGYHINGIDIDEVAIKTLQEKYPGSKNGFRVASIEQAGFPDNFFDHIICSAVLHFAKATAHFNAMLAELVRMVKPGGSVFIRMTSDIGIEERVELVADGVYNIPDGSARFLLNRQLLADCMAQYNLSFLEPLKTVNVDDNRCMSTLLLQKNADLYLNK
jgi:tellurite methyltransferase